MTTQTQNAPLTLSDAAADAVQTLLTRHVDAREGFQTMAEKAKPEFVPVARRFRALHAGHADRLSALLRSAGRQPDTGGSVMSRINPAVVSVRAIFDAIDKDAMDQIRRGEEPITEALDRAIDAASGTWAARALAEMRTEHQSLLARTRNPG